MNTTTANLTPDEIRRRMDVSVEYRIREEKMGDGTLRIFETRIGGELAAEVFTLESLAHVMGMPMSTMEGRYKRAKLSRWMVPVPSMAGRPMRGFPYKLLETVIGAIQHPRAFIDQDAQGSRVAVPRTTQIGDLVPEYYSGERYYTVAALARAFSLSETTIRNKLNIAGLMRRFQNLQSPPQGGRPKRGIHERHMAEVKMAIHDNVQFFTKYDTAIYRASGLLQQARDEMRAAVVPHTPPAPGSLQAWDPFELAPATKAPVNDVYSDTPEIQDLMAEIDAIASKIKVDPGDPGTSSLAPAEHTTPERTLAEGTLDHMPSEREAQRLEREEQAANRRALIGPQRQLLINDPDEPTQEDLDDTCYALDLHGDEAHSFIQSVRDGRAEKWEQA